MSRWRKQEPSPAFAAEEQARADNLAKTIAWIKEHPRSVHASNLHHYQAAYRNASSNAAAHGEQPT